MRVIVAGGTGFIGSALVRALHDRGDQVSVLALHPERVGPQFGAGVQGLEWHPPVVGPWADALSGADAVINLAGHRVVQPLNPWTASEKARILSSRVDSTRALVEALRAAQPRPATFINGSAIGCYGSQGNVVLTEESPPGNDFLAGVVKQWEAAARPAEELGVRLVLLRTANVLGDGGLLPQLALPFKLYLGGDLGPPGQWFSWIHLQDEVDLIIHALTHDTVRGPVNATSPNPVTMSEFSHDLGAALHRPVWVPLVPLFLRVALGQRAQAVLSSQRVEPEVALSTGYVYRHPQVEEALRSILETPAAVRASGPSL